MHSAIAVESCAALTTSNTVAIPSFGVFDAAGDDTASQNAEDLFREAMTSAATLSRLTEPGTGPVRVPVHNVYWIPRSGSGVAAPGSGIRHRPRPENPII